MIRKIARATGLLLLLVGCDQQKQTAGQHGNTAAQTGENDANRIAKMTEGGRNAVFGRALQDAKLQCRAVKHSAAAGVYQGMPMWTVNCDDSGPWTVVIGKGGMAQILTANPLKPVSNDQNSTASDNK